MDSGSHEMKSIKLETLKRYVPSSNVSKISHVKVVMANYRLHKSWPWGHVSVSARLEDLEPYSDPSTSGLLTHLQLSWDEISSDFIVVVSVNDFNTIQAAMFIA